MVRGDLSPYDTAVAVEISQYRIETEKLKTGGQLIDSLREEARQLILERLASGELIRTQSETIATLYQANREKDQNFKDLNANFDNLLAIANEPKKWYEKPGFIIGAVVGLELLQIFISPR